MNDDMLVVTEIKVTRCSRHQMQIAPREPMMNDYRSPADLMPKPTFETETIDGERFFMPDGRTVVLGWSLQCREAVGIPLSLMQAQHEQMEDQTRQQLSLQERYRQQSDFIVRAGRLSLWQRLRFLFGTDLATLLDQP